MLLEGLEVVFIVLTFGANQHDVGLAAAPPPSPCWSWSSPGSPSTRPLARVPENTMKFAVGVMLTSFGMFWGGEGAGAHWPGGDAALLVIIPRRWRSRSGWWWCCGGGPGCGRRRRRSAVEAVRA